MIRMSVVSAVLCGMASTAGAADVSRQVEVNAAADAVWEQVGGFCAIADWYPGVDSCTEEEIDGAAHRRLKTADGAEFLEKRMETDAGDHSYGYAIIESRLPVADYVATFSVSANGDSSVITWSSSFEPVDIPEEEATALIGGIYDTGLAALAERFGE